MSKNTRNRRAENSGSGAARPRTVVAGTKAMNFKVPLEFHTEFKTFASARNRSMTDLLLEAFELVRRKYPG